MYTKEEYNQLLNLTNEELIVKIQLTNEDKYWARLYEKTEACIFNIYHKKVHKFYKETMKDDIISLLKIGWTKAVVKYDLSKATCGFVAWASTIIEQEYVSFAKKRTKLRDGSSIKAEYFESVHSSNLFNNEHEDKALNGCVVNILEDKDSQNDFFELERNNLVDQKLLLLKKQYPISYKIIIDNIFLCKTQNEIANEFGLKQTSVSRYMKLGKTFLKQNITKDEKESCLYTK